MECCLLFFFELAFVFGKIPSLASGTSLLSFSLFLRSVLIFQSVRTWLMKNFDLYFFKRWSFLFSDVCLTQCSPRESYSSNWSEHFGSLPRNRCRLWRLSVLSTALWSSPFSALCLVVLQPSSAETSTLRRIYNPIQTYRIDILEDANTHKVI